MGRKENRRRSRLERISERKNSDSNVLPSMEPFFSNENERVYRVHAESGAPGMHNAEEFMRLTHTISDKELNQLLYLQAKDSVEHGVFKEFPENDFGCVMWFMFTFITPEMRDAFPEIVREYLDHEEMFRVELFDDIPYPRPNEKTWDDAFYFRVLGMMVHAARRGSKYSKNFLISLYKVYYKKEYNRLKNLKVLTLLDYLEIFDLDCKERGLASGHTTNGEITFAEQEIERRRHEAGWVDVFGDRLSNYVPFKRGVIDDDEEAYQASQELKQILDSPDEPPLEPVGCRLLIMCEMLGIKVDKTCIGQSLQMNMAREHALKLELYGNDEIRRLIREITERTRAWSIASHPEMADPYLYQSNDKYLHLQIAEEIAYNTFFHMGRSVRLLYDSKKFDLPGLISNVLLTMDGNFPGYELGFGETLYLAMIQYLSECMCDLLITRDTEIEELMHFHRKVYDGE